jgi:hypothetical protein
VRSLPACIALCLLVGCAGPQATRTRRHAELAIGASLVGVIVSSLGIAAFPDHKPIFIGITAGFGAVAIGSAIVYGVAHSNAPPEPAAPPPAPPDHRAEAWHLTQLAQGAARNGDCNRVRELGAQILILDAGFYETVFARDAAVARCLGS